MTFHFQFPFSPFLYFPIGRIAGNFFFLFFVKLSKKYLFTRRYINKIVYNNDNRPIVFEFVATLLRTNYPGQVYFIHSRSFSQFDPKNWHFKCLLLECLSKILIMVTNNINFKVKDLFWKKINRPHNMDKTYCVVDSPPPPPLWNTLFMKV